MRHSENTSADARAPYTLLVNSSDGFVDCWEPFFTLLDTYWPDRNCPVLLNTEKGIFHSPRADVRSSQVNLGTDRRLTWSECLIAAIEQVETPLMLYMQEDYFLDRKVESARLEQIASLMLENKNIKHVGLTKHGSKGPFEHYATDGLLKINQKAGYRISTQAGLWRPETLLSYLDPAESGWMFEIFGTRRAWRNPELFLTVDAKQCGPVMDYTHTGIIKGQWHKDIPALFRQHDIHVDFTRRGFYKPLPGPLHKWTLAKKLLQDPARAFRYLLWR